MHQRHRISSCEISPSEILHGSTKAPVKIFAVSLLVRSQSYRRVCLDLEMWRYLLSCKSTSCFKKKCARTWNRIESLEPFHRDLKTSGNRSINYLEIYLFIYLKEPFEEISILKIFHFHHSPLYSTKTAVVCSAWCAFIL